MVNGYDGTLPHSVPLVAGTLRVDPISVQDCQHAFCGLFKSMLHHYLLKAWQYTPKYQASVTVILWEVVTVFLLSGNPEVNAMDFTFCYEVWYHSLITFNTIV